MASAYHRDVLQPSSPKTKKAVTTKEGSSPVNSFYQINIIHNDEAFTQLKQSWNTLVSSSKDPNPFVLWEWMFTWWETYSELKDKLYIIAVYDGSTLISVAPFYIKKQLGFISRLSFLGEGEKHVDEAVTHYPDIIVSKDLNKTQQNEAIRCITEFLRRDMESKKNSFDYASFDLLKENNTLHQVAKALAPNLSVQYKTDAKQFLLSLPDNEDDYIAGLSKSSRKQFRLKHNRMLKLGEIEISTEENLKEGLAIAEKLHRARWSHQPDTVFDSIKFSLFHQKLCEQFEGQDIMTFRTLRIDNTPIVSAYNFNYKNTCFSYLSGFESPDDNRLSPMFIFDILEMKNFMQQKISHVDFLVSEDANSYKAKFGCDVVPVYKSIWFKRSFTSRVLESFFSLKNYLSRLKQKLIR